MFSSIVPLQNKITSSTNSKYNMDSLLPTPILEVFLVLFTSTMDFHNPSTTSRNKYGDNGNTYLKPLVVLKKGEVEQLIRTT